MQRSARFQWIRPLFLVVAALLLAGGTAPMTPLGAQEGQEGDAVADVPVVPTDHGGAVRKLLLARPFQLEQEHTYHWLKEKPKITQGILLVLEVDKSYARPRQVNVPVLYVGDKPAEITNIGHESGRMIVLIPGPVDLTRTPIFFGSVQLPERVDAERGLQELAAAKALGIRPFPKKDVEAALRKGGAKALCNDPVDLYRVVSDLILEYAPDEVERAESYRGG